ncbi:MAG: threonine--tRNA ligase [Bacillota bacterium]|nr:threonine--tRNA ligase [Bacillota bacterium]
MNGKEIQVGLPDGSVRAFPAGVTVAQVAEAIGPRLARAAVAAEVDGEAVDLDYRLDRDCSLSVLTAESPKGLEVLRHSTAHVMAQAVLRLYPEAKLSIGPAIEHGFYYDFDLPAPLRPEDLERIEAEMRRIVQEDLPIRREVVSREEARRLFAEAGQKYKVELLQEIPDPKVSLYRQGEFVDLCRGPHLPSTGRLRAFKLQNVAGAYWRGDARNPMLQRIYGLAFATQEDLDRHLRMLEEAAKRDHRKLGRELDLFAIMDEGPGFPFFLPHGMVIRHELEEFWRQVHRARGYQEIRTPIILNEELWHRSGHWDHYRENMYFTEIDGQPYAVKPMNCPGAMLVYRRRVHSYRDLPVRLAELGLVHRHELSGVLHGLMRVRCFTQDDAHIFMLPSQVQAEIEGVIDLIDYFYREVFGFPYRVELSTRPEKALGSPEMWELATSALAEALRRRGMEFKINEGEGAFYGPKIDFHLQDSLGRTWQCGTIQLDFQMPERFDLTYVGEDGERHRPVMLHRVVFGSIERFIAILTEHFAGAFPTWLAPVQVRVLTVSPLAQPYGREVVDLLAARGLRAELDDRDETVSYKVREGEVRRIPYLAVVGEREAASRTVSVRARGRKGTEVLGLEDFAARVKEEVRLRRRGEG